MSDSNLVTTIKNSVTQIFPQLAKPWRDMRRKRLFPNQSFRVGLERPLANEACAGEIEICGWAVSLDETPVSGQILINGHLVIPVSLTEARADVAKAFDLEDSQSLVGFRHKLNWQTIGRDVDRAEICVEFSHGTEVIVLGPVTVYPAHRAPKQRFAFRLERPANDEIISQAIEIRGWALSLDDWPISGKIVIDDQQVLPLEFNQAREDVASFYQLSADHPPVGFEQQIEWEDLGENTTQAKIAVEILHGGDLLLLGPFTVVNTKAPLLRHQRGSYKEVWESAASDAVSANATVAGSGDWAELKESGISTAQTIKEALLINPEDTVLEIGCGVGRIGFHLAGQCKKWIGADISSNMLINARENLKLLDNVELVELHSCALPQFADNSLDKLYCSTVFMHLDEWDRYRYVTEAYRVLRQGGMCYFDNVNLAGAQGWQIFKEMAAIDPTKRSPAITKPSTAEELSTYLRMAGFSEIQVRPEEHYITVIGKKL